MPNDIYYIVVVKRANMSRHFLGEFERAVLIALIRLRDEAYGMTIRRYLSDRLGHDIAIGAVYTTLQRLETKGYVSSFTGDPTPQRGGRAKRFFHLEAPGVDALNRSREHALLLDVPEPQFGGGR